tara:strand:+ start:35594 stop:36352 length:759 start_codon:yes stop_codon:yes gene_type:complete
MSTLAEITDFADNYLRIASFKDYCPNGLQVEGRQNVVKIASAVTASMAIIEQILEWGADCLIVHHGYFWKNERVQVVGMKKRRLQALLGADVSLLAYHLPLDAHPVVGNNAQIAERLGISNLQPLQKSSKTPVGNVGTLEDSIDIQQFVDNCSNALVTDPIHINSGPRQVQRIAWCTGGAQHMITDAVDCQADVYLTGEISEQTVHIARECNIHFIAAGHHATERYGVQAMAALLGEKFNLEHQYFDEINPA